jgi:hypothetical protein
MGTTHAFDAAATVRLRRACTAFVADARGTSPRVHLATAYSRGPPHDRGLNLSQAHRIFEDTFAPHFDSYRGWTIAELRVVAPQLTREFPDTDALPFNPGFEKVGFLAYKAHVLRAALDSAAAGDVVVYRDMNVLKYPQYSGLPTELRGLALWTLGASGADFFVGITHERWPVLRTLKSSAIRELVLGFWPSASALRRGYAAVEAEAATRGIELPLRLVHHFPELMANFIVVRKSAQGYAMLGAWARALRNERWLRPEPDEAPHPCFHHFTPDQGLLAVTAIRRIFAGQLPPDYPRFGFNLMGRCHRCECVRAIQPRGGWLLDYVRSGLGEGTLSGHRRTLPWRNQNRTFAHQVE